MGLIGIRREDKNKWERRVPLTPKDVLGLQERHQLGTVIQPSAIRTFEDGEYSKAGAVVSEDLSDCPLVLAVKEIPASLFAPNKTYVFFSHVIKGQTYNMPMLRKMMELGCNLFDYECITDDQGRRLIFFGRYAGIAGMIDSLWALGQRLAWEGASRNPFLEIEQTWRYPSLEAAMEAVSKAGDSITRDGLPSSISPLVFGVMGYGNVSLGAQEVLRLLPNAELAPEELSEAVKKPTATGNQVFITVFREEHLVVPAAAGRVFELQDYYAHPENYRSRFEDYIPFLSVLVNGIYWDERYPRFVTRSYLKRLYEQNADPRLRVIGDITCDIEGSIECNLESTEPSDPVYVYDPLSGEIHYGVQGTGPVVMAVDNLPCELPREASRDFGKVLVDFIPDIVAADFSVSFDELDLPSALKRALILHRGRLTPDYSNLEAVVAT